MFMLVIWCFRLFLPCVFGVCTPFLRDNDLARFCGLLREQFLAALDILVRSDNVDKPEADKNVGAPIT